MHLRTLVLVLAALALTGCLTTRRGGVVASKRVPGSEQVVASTYRVAVRSAPSVEDPHLTVQLLRRDSLRVQMQDTHQAVRGPSVGWNILGGLAWSALGAWSVKKGLGMKDEVADTITNAGFLVTLGGVVALAGGIASFYMATQPDDVETLDVFVPGRSRWIPDVREISGGSGQRITVAAGAGTVESLTNDQGTAAFSLERDLDLGWFQEPREVDFVLGSELAATSARVRLSSGSWTVACVRVNGAGRLLADPSGAATALGEFNDGEGFRLELQRPDWVGVRYGASIGWVPRIATTGFWSIVRDGRCVGGGTHSPGGSIGAPKAGGGT